MVEVNISNEALQAAAERANSEQRSVIDVINTLLRDYAAGRTWLNLPAGDADAVRVPPRPAEDDDRENPVNPWSSYGRDVAW